jgi:hypothetical protein
MPHNVKDQTGTQDLQLWLVIPVFLDAVVGSNF